VTETDKNMKLLGSIWRRQADIEASAVLGSSCFPPEMPLQEMKAEEYRFIARQAIFDRSQKVHGYELLCRSGWENYFHGDSDEATRMMIADSALYGLHELTRGAVSFVNCTRESLVDGSVTLLPNSTVLEILETVVADDEVLKACAHYKELGYKLALDDFRLSQGMEGLIALTDYIKVDFRLSEKQERDQIMASLKGRGLILVAEKVETEEEFQAAMTEGFELFQGYFFCHPTVFSKKKMPMNGANYLHLLSALSLGHFNVVQLTALLKPEVAISYQLLRLVNSAAFGLSHEVRSLQDALVLVGEQQFRKLMMNAIATETCRERPSELLLHVLHRARFLELVATFTGENPAEQYLFGLLSLMDVMLDLPAAELIEGLPLRQEMKDALAGHPNQVNAALRLLESYEYAEWTQCARQSVGLHISEGELTRIYRESLQWAEKATSYDERRNQKAS
jgi:EAL and modified HD-GYP domain-containing signal transduction protein